MNHLHVMWRDEWYGVQMREKRPDGWWYLLIIDFDRNIEQWVHESEITQRSESEN